MHRKNQQLILEFVERSIKINKQHIKELENIWLNLGDVPKETVVYIEEKFNINIIGYKYVLEASYINHALQRHGEESNDRCPINVSDFLLIPLIISSFDEIEVGTLKKNNLKSLLFKKKIGNQWFYTMATEVRTGKKSLAFNTLYKRKTRK